MHPLMLYLAVTQDHERRHRQVRLERAVRGSILGGVDGRPPSAPVIQRGAATVRAVVGRLAAPTTRRGTRSA